MADREAGAGPRTGKADEVLGGNIRYEKRCANREPSDVAAGKEVIGRASLLAGKVKADRKDNQEIQTDDDEVDGRQSAVGNGDEMFHSFDPTFDLTFDPMPAPKSHTAARRMCRPLIKRAI